MTPDAYLDALEKQEKFKLIPGDLIYCGSAEFLKGRPISDELWGETVLIVDSQLGYWCSLDSDLHGTDNNWRLTRPDQQPSTLNNMYREYIYLGPRKELVGKYVIPDKDDGTLGKKRVE